MAKDEIEIPGTIRFVEEESKNDKVSVDLLRGFISLASIYKVSLIMSMSSSTSFQFFVKSISWVLLPVTWKFTEFKSQEEWNISLLAEVKLVTLSQVNLSFRDLGLYTNE